MRDPPWPCPWSPAKPYGLKKSGCRQKPGLRRQHLTAVEAAQRVSDADVSDVEIGSTSLEFHPGKTRPGEYRFAIGTAGSTTLVLQTVLPPLMLADASSHLVLEGGTHNPLAPPYEFLAKAYLPLLGQLGPTVLAESCQPGFYPVGGGHFEVSIKPLRRVASLRIARTWKTDRPRSLLR